MKKFYVIFALYCLVTSSPTLQAAHKKKVIKKRLASSLPARSETPPPPPTEEETPSPALEHKISRSETPPPPPPSSQEEAEENEAPLPPSITATEEDWFNAAATGDLPTLKKLFATDPTLLEKTDSQYHEATALLSALGIEFGSPLLKRQEDIFYWLLAQGANPKVVDSEGYDALMYAARGFRSNVLQTLINAGVRVDERSDDNISAVQVAIANNNQDAVFFLLNNGASDKEAWFTAARYGNVNIMQKLLTKNANLLETTDANDLKKTALLDVLDIPTEGDLESIRSRQEAAFYWLLKHNADYTVTDDDGFNALMYAAYSGFSQKILQTLISKGIPVNAQNKNGTTALMFAANSGNKATTLFLLQQGADENLTDNDGNTARDYAKEKESFEAFEIFDKSEAIVPPAPALEEEGDIPPPPSSL